MVQTIALVVITLALFCLAVALWGYWYFGRLGRRWERRTNEEYARDWRSVKPRK